MLMARLRSGAALLVFGGALLCRSDELAEEESRRGNILCWDAPNWVGVQLTYEDCCQGSGSEEGGDGPDCFAELGGWYSHDFCCFPPVPDSCDWDGGIAESLYQGLGEEQARPPYNNTRS